MISADGTDLTRELIAAERKFIHVLLRDGKITDETRRRIERDLDLEEASLANREYRRMPLLKIAVIPGSSKDRRQVPMPPGNLEIPDSRLRRPRMTEDACYSAAAVRGRPT